MKRGKFKAATELLFRGDLRFLQMRVLWLEGNDLTTVISAECELFDAIPDDEVAPDYEIQISQTASGIQFTAKRLDTSF